ncbi:hypothetical protein ACOMHN_013518 [Nucella lapillus]
MDGDGDIQDGSSGGTQDCRDIDDGGYGLDYSEDIIPDDDNVSNEAQPITGGQSQGIAAQEPKRKKAKSRPASASEGGVLDKGSSVYWTSHGAVNQTADTGLHGVSPPHRRRVERREAGFERGQDGAWESPVALIARIEGQPFSPQADAVCSGLRWTVGQRIIDYRSPCVGWPDSQATWFSQSENANGLTASHGEFGASAVNESGKPRGDGRCVASVLQAWPAYCRRVLAEAVTAFVQQPVAISPACADACSLIASAFDPALPSLISRWRGVCQPYNGSVCRDQLAGRVVYHNITARSAPSAFPDPYRNNDNDDNDDDVYLESEHEAIVRELVAEMEGTGVFTGRGGERDDYCLGPALNLLCHYAFPDCRFTQSRYVMPVPVCRESCLAVHDLFCFRQWVEIEEKKKQNVFFKKRAHFRLPDCESLPSLWEPDEVCTEADVHAKATLEEITEECYVGTGQWYNGTVNVTSSGLACQPWTDNYPQQHERSPLVFPELIGAENYCRNPGSEEDRPWCYTMVLEKRWEFCPVPKCGTDNVTQAESGPQEESPRFSLLAVIVIAGVSALGVIILALFVALLLRSLRRRRSGGYLGYKAAAKDDMDAAIAQLPVNAAYHQVRASGKLNPKLEGYEFPRNDIVFLRDIGQGAFGRVFKAKVAGLHAGCGRIRARESALIAVKMLKEDASEDLQQDFEREASLMADFDHPNIVRLLGVCAVGKPMCLLFEFMSKGDLNEFLRLCSPEHFSLRIPRSRNHTVDLEDGLRVEVEEEEETGGEEEGGEESPARLSMSEQLYMAQQVAGGMAYLAQRGYVHRDLATRNCLVGHDLVVKISDFGLARSVHSLDYYRGSEHDAIPIRWMPLEAILYNKFSTQSDVWSFGVVLWEIFAFALQPYYGLTHEQVVRYLKEGQVLAAPDRTPPALYALMKSCWHARPSARPPFPALHHTLHTMHAQHHKGHVKLKEVA